METLVEQRAETRTDLSWPVSMWLPNANRFFNGHSSNISKTGVLVKLPMMTPVSEGNIVEVNFPRTSTLAEQKGQYARLKKGRVVRVDRGDILTEASIGIAVQFD